MYRSLTIIPDSLLTFYLYFICIYYKYNTIYFFPPQNLTALPKCSVVIRSHGGIDRKCPGDAFCSPLGFSHASLSNLLMTYLLFNLPQFQSPSVACIHKHLLHIHAASVTTRSAITLHQLQVCHHQY